MKLPWVSRLAFDAVSAERDRLLADNAKMLDSLVRLQRIEHGVAETPRVARPPEEPIPREILDFCSGFDDPRVGKRIRDECFRAHARGNESWESIKQRVLAPQEGPLETDR